MTVTFAAANSNPAPGPVATVTTVDSRTAPASDAAQNITLTATVSGGTVNQGVVTFQVMDGAVNVGAAATSATLTNGTASVIYALPAGLAAKDYVIRAAYSGGTNPTSAVPVHR